MATGATTEFGSRLRALRLAAGLTQEALANRAGLSTRGVSDLERGLRLPQQRTLRALTGALGLDPREREALAAARSSHVSGHRQRANGAWISLFGREAEMQRILAHVLADGPSLLFVSGEPGIGKTRLLDETAERAAAFGLAVLYGRSERGLVKEPFDPLPALVGGFVRRLSRGPARRALMGCEWLGRAVPELAPHAGTPPAESVRPEQERRLVFEAAARFLANVRGTRGTLLLLDDLQWAGADTLDLVAFLAGQAGSERLRMVAAYRDTELEGSSPLLARQAELIQAGRAGCQPVGPLGHDASAALLVSLLGERMADAAASERLLRLADGVPFFIITGAQELLASPGVDAAAGSVPRTVEITLRQRLARPPGAAREVIALAAVAAGPIAPPLLLRTGLLADSDLLHGLDAACAAGILSEDGRGSYRFVHDVIRDVAEAELGAARRVVLHRLLAETIERRAGETEYRPAQLAFHLERGGLPGRAIPYLLAAGERAEGAAALIEAERHFEHAARLAAEVGDRTAEASALLRQGHVQRITARYDEALAVLERAASLFRDAGEEASEARAVAEIGMTHRERGATAEGIERLRPVIERLTASGRSAELARVRVTLANLLFVAGQYEESAREAEGAVEVARAMCDDALLAEAGARLGACLTNLDRNQEAMLHLEDAVARARSCGRLDILAVAITNLAFACSWEGDKHRSVALLREAVSVIERLSDRGWLVLALANLGDALIALGEWQEGRVHLEAALTLSEGLTSWVCAHARIYFARLLTRTGDMDGAVELLQETIPLAEQSGDLMALIDIQMHLAHFDIERGCAERAIQRLTLALDNTYPLRRSGVLVLLARAHLALGDAERAIQLASQARNEAARFAGVQRDALVVLGRAQTALGRWAEAEESLQAALRHAAFERDPQFEADVVLAMGELAAARGEPEIARTTFAEAIATYERLGAAAALERARAVAMRPAT